jgi:hypothetical protein
MLNAIKRIRWSSVFWNTFTVIGHLIRSTLRLISNTLDYSVRALVLMIIVWAISVDQLPSSFAEAQLLLTVGFVCSTSFAALACIVFDAGKFSSAPAMEPVMTEGSIKAKSQQTQNAAQSE